MMKTTPIAALITTVALLAPPAFAQQGTAPDGATTTVPPGIPPHTTPTAPDGTSPTTSPTGQVDVQTKPDLGQTTPAPAQSTDPGTAAPPAEVPAAPGAATTAPAAPAAPADTAVTPAAPVTPPAADRPAMATGLLAPEGYTQVTDFAAVTADQLKGAELRSAEGKDVGKITELRSTSAGVPEALIADIGGFLGLGAHTVQLTPDQIGIFKNDSDSIIVASSLTEDVLKSLPAWEAPAQ